MSRPKGYAVEEARTAFRKELEHCMLDLGIGSKKELAVRAGKAPRTMYRKFEDVTTMDLADLAVLKDILCPDPLILLKAIGYANAERFLGVYPGNPTGRTHIALGGADCTRYGTLYVRLLLRWGKSQVAAEKQAQALWELFYGLTNADMDGATVSFVDPGSGPVPMGRGGDGVFEYTINLTITYMKE